MKKPLYSIVIPAFNEEKYLPHTLESVKNSMQHIKDNGELIVVDNNSTDQTAVIAKKFGATVIFEKLNQIATARNAGGKKAQGEFIIFLDADTTLTAEILQKALKLLKSGVAGGGITIQFNKKLAKPYIALVGLWNLFSKTFKIGAGCFIFCQKQVFDEIEGFNENLYASEELYFCLNLKKWAKKHNKKVFIIHDISIVSSARKFEWFKPWQFWGLIIMIFFLPLFGFSKKMTQKWWYERPKNNKP